MVGRVRDPEHDTIREQVFRHCRPNHTDLDATLEASRNSAEPSRFNVRGEFGALYVATDPDTALAELDAHAARLALSRAELLPRVLLTLDMHVAHVLDLTDRSIRDVRGLEAEDLRDEDYTRCQRVGRQARGAGHEAILYPSARGDGENFAIFLDRLGPGSHLRSTAPPRDIPPTGRMPEPHLAPPELPTG